ASRVRGTEATTILLNRGGLDDKKKSSRRRSVFFLTPFIELIRHLERVCSYYRRLLGFPAAFCRDRNIVLLVMGLINWSS
ncbi:MAG: hypothetical protein WA224_20170, partial [Candidatus Acidiferrales bacterium]